jgi:hypothetical protein
MLACILGGTIIGAGLGFVVRSNATTGGTDIIAMILPDIDKSNIRPAYQKTKQPQPTGMNYVSQDGKSNGIMSFGNTDNFVYFYVRPDVNSEAESEVSADNQMLLLNVNDMKRQRKKAASEISRIFGRNASVELSEEFEIIEKTPQESEEPQEKKEGENVEN